MIKNFILKLFFNDLVVEIVKLRAELYQYKLALGDAYLTLDRIALRDDSPSIELSRMALHCIEKHKINVKRMEQKEMTHVASH